MDLMNDEISEKAVRAHQEKKLKLLLELILGDHVGLLGVKETRRRLLWHARHLKEFE